MHRRMDGELVDGKKEGLHCRLQSSTHCLFCCQNELSTKSTFVDFGHPLLLVKVLIGLLPPWNEIWTPNSGEDVPQLPDAKPPLTAPAWHMPCLSHQGPGIHRLLCHAPHASHPASPSHPTFTLKTKPKYPSNPHAMLHLHADPSVYKNKCLVRVQSLAQKLPHASGTAKKTFLIKSKNWMDRLKN